MTILIRDCGCWWQFETDMALFQYYMPSAAMEFGDTAGKPLLRLPDGTLIEGQERDVIYG